MQLTSDVLYQYLLVIDSEAHVFLEWTIPYSGISLEAPKRLPDSEKGSKRQSSIFQHNMHVVLKKTI